MLVADLRLDIDPGFVLQNGPDVECHGLVTYHFRGEGFVFEDFYRSEAVIADATKNGVEESEQLDLATFLAKYLVKKVVIEGVKSL
jgi:hypothetical protein